MSMKVSMCQTKISGSRSGSGCVSDFAHSGDVDYSPVNCVIASSVRGQSHGIAPLPDHKGALIDAAHEVASGETVRSV